MINDADLKFEHRPADTEASVERLFFRTPEAAAANIGGPGKAAKAEAVPVRSEMTVSEAVETIVKSCLEHFQANEPAVLERRQATALHQLRVSMRRLRVALSLFGPAMRDPQFENLRDELRWFTGQLGEARNLDVFLIQKGLPKSMRTTLKAERESAYDRVVAALRSNRLRLLLIDLIAWVELGQWRQNAKASRQLPDFVARRLYKWWQKIAHHGDLKTMHSDERHELRIEIKKLRYALDFVQLLHTSAGRKQKQFYKSVEDLQGSLGKLNDVATARTLWRKFGRKLLRSKSQERELEDKCMRAAQASLARMKKIGPYWTRLT